MRMALDGIVKPPFVVRNMYNMDVVVTKPVLGVSDQVMLKQANSATETS